MKNVLTGVIIAAIVSGLGASVASATMQPPPQQQQAAAADAPKPRLLSEAEQKDVVIVLQTIEVWTAKRDLAVAELQRAQENAQKLVSSICGERGTLDTRSMSCQPPQAGGK